MAIHNPTDTEEIWKPVPGWPGYEASNLGRIRSYLTRGKVLPHLLSPRINYRGYRQVHLRNKESDKTILVHSIIALTFLGARPTAYTVNHRDGIKTNNHLENLEYVTQSENLKHSFRLGLSDNKGENHSQAILTAELVTQIREELTNRRRGDFARLGRKYGTHWVTIRDIYYRRTWRHIP